jgi:hypothetical protein
MKKKIRDFVHSNDLLETNMDPTKQYHKTIRNLVNKCNITIPKNVKWKVNCLNPKPPQLKGFIKLHKAGNPI